jgi:hypothetical protein
MYPYKIYILYNICIGRDGKRPGGLDSRAVLMPTNVAYSFSVSAPCTFVKKRTEGGKGGQGKKEGGRDGGGRKVKVKVSVKKGRKTVVHISTWRGV